MKIASSGFTPKDLLTNRPNGEDESNRRARAKAEPSRQNREFSAAAPRERNAATPGRRIDIYV